jgi:hypothetical protein
LDPIFEPTEIDNPVHSLVATTSVPGGDEPLIVAATLLLLTFEQTLLRLGTWCEFGKVAARRISSSWRSWLMYSYSHDPIPVSLLFAS